MSRGKRALFTALVLGAVYAFAELGAWLIGTWRDPGEALRQSAPQHLRRRFGLHRHFMHPYLGYGLMPHSDSPADLSHVPVDTPPGQVNVGFFGGSVATQIVVGMREELERRLEEAPGMGGRKVRIFNFALGGYKQPQQLMALTYALARGFPLHLAVNLDGFNEVALYPTENRSAGLTPYYPRSWHLFYDGLSNPARMALHSELASLRRARYRWADRWVALPFSTPLMWLGWSAWDGFLERKTAAIQRELIRLASAEPPYGARGPRTMFPSDEAMYGELAGIWKRASLQMHRICRANGIRYFHFLQPNQYLENAKPMGTAEARAVLGRARELEGPVRAGYARLLSAVPELESAGVAFHDLTRLFAGEKAPVFSDACCHFNKRGIRRIGERIAGVLLASLGSAAALPARHSGFPAPVGPADPVFSGSP